MEYEIVTLKQKKVAGLKARTANTDPDMGQVIGGLWQKLFDDGVIGRIPGRVNSYTIGLYSDYENKEQGKYDITVGCEVEQDAPLPKELAVKVIPAGRYARFDVFGDMSKAVGKAWEEIGGMGLRRTFTGDFEEYVSCDENGQCEIRIYIAVE